jgi:hypothetical protein
LADGLTVNVPQQCHVDWSTPERFFKLRGARIGVGSSPVPNDRSFGALQVLGTPYNKVILYVVSRRVLRASTPIRW